MTREDTKEILSRPFNMKNVPQDILEAHRIAIEALEQEPKSEWEHDHAILKAYSDGANDVLDKIRAEIEEYANDQYSEGEYMSEITIFEIIDKYRR